MIRKTSESEMILEFLKGEFNSRRFNKDLIKALMTLKLDSSIIVNGNISNKKENFDRLKIMKIFRGYPDDGLFERFPKIDEWKFMELNEKDIDNIYYIDYDYWNELSNGTSKPIEAAKVIKNGKEIFGVSNQSFLDGVEYNKTNTFPPVILITCNDEKYLIIEGHSRMTIYGFNPSKMNGTYAYIGYTTEERMKKYDKR
ncbi:MAG: hypothetical protein PHI05_04470 [Bacilli bacterium]|nr:hypothetical protein [Bacilli bacterium]